MFTMIDTPGFGDDLENEERTIDELVNVLKNKVFDGFPDWRKRFSDRRPGFESRRVFFRENMSSNAVV
jgi:septin family protein